MQTFTGYEYLLIDIANQFGLDKQTFETRIEWAKAHLDTLESLADQAGKTKPLYLKAVMAFRKAQAGVPIGHLVGFDASCSGIQIMSAMTGCVSGARATGLVDPDTRADAYTTCTNVMQTILGSTLTVKREDAKTAMMTAFYGSRLKPIEIFGEDTPELNAFYQAANQVAPGAWQLLQELLGSWRPYALSHEWVLPDGFEAKVKVMTKKEARIEVDELDHASFTYEFYENTGTKKGLSNAANVTHSVDAYVLRSMHRRCNYNRPVVEYAAAIIEMELIKRSLYGETACMEMEEKVYYYCNHYNRSGMADVCILPYLTEGNVVYLGQQHLEALAKITSGMLAYKPFPVVTIHDEFKCHPNNMNHLRQQYVNILAELADSWILEDILNQLHQTTDGKYQKLSNDLSTLIRGSNYALC